MAPVSKRQRLLRWAWRARAFLLVVLMPTLIVAVYYLLFAANQYESEAHFIVRTNEQTVMPASGIGQMLGITGMGNAHGETQGVGDYLESHDAVASLRSGIDLVARFRRPEADLLSRLFFADPTPETLLKYYRRQVDVGFDSETGIATLHVRSFRPEDSLTIIRKLFELGEQRVNSLNNRSYEVTLRASLEQLVEAEAHVREAQVALTRFRQARGNIDPLGTGEAQIRLVSSLSQQLAQARAQLASMGAAIRSDSPQYVALASHVRSLEAQVAAQDGQLTNGSNSIASDLGDYQELQLRQAFAAKRYEAAAASVEKAREQAQRQQLFIVRLVEPNLPIKALYPKSLKIIATVFLTLLLFYALGWLIAVGFREHAS